MPEAPDVEVYRQYIASTSLHQTIVGVEIGDDRLLEDATRHELAENLAENLAGTAFEDATRTGKYLFVELSRGGHPLLHFGMTGLLSYYKHGGDAPDYAQCVIRFDNDYRLAYVNRRILGRIGLVSDVGTYLRDHDVGPDALRLSEEEFRRIIGRGRGAVKTTLMNQKMMSGLGNVYSDECGGTVVNEQISGRSCYFCPERQREYS